MQVMKEIKIIFENQDFLVIDKPAGMLVHPTLNQEKNTIANWLIKKYPNIKQVGEDKTRPGIVHRLDRDTSGLLVIAKNNIYFNYCQQYSPYFIFPGKTHCKSNIILTRTNVRFIIHGCSIFNHKCEILQP